MLAAARRRRVGIPTVTGVGWWVIGLVEFRPARPFSNALALFELARRRCALRQLRQAEAM
jgi:hypothetical protein